MHTHAMKRLLFVVGVAVISSLGFGGSCPESWAVEGLKVGYVNLGRIFDDYQRTKDSEAALKQKGTQKEAELKNRVTELTAMRKNLELLSDKARETKAREIEEKSDALQQQRTKDQRELSRERDQAARQILAELEQAVNEYAKANGFSFILDQRSLLYGQDAYDVTDPILRMLNDRYTSKTTKKAAP